jgi:hypothetical protein
MGLTVDLHQNCERVLMRCWEFKDKSTLEPLFGIEPLPKYAGALPLEARSQVHLINLIIHNLVSDAATKGQPLLDLIIVLRDKRDKEDGQRDELDDLFKQVSFYLRSLTAETETKSGEAERKETETKELHAAIRNYQLAGGEDTRNISDADAANWIAQVYDQPVQWAFRIALAVFNGAPWDTCMEAALELAARLPSPDPVPTDGAPRVRPVQPVQPASPAAPRLNNPLKLLSEAGGELASAGTFRVVKLKEPQLARAVLDNEWDEYTRRELLIEWLTSLVVNRNFTKRIRASVATGLLMLTNFDSIRWDVLYNWAHADEERSLYRLAIGRALSVVAEEGGRLEEVRDLLKLWTGSSDRALRWAAARAYVYVGVRCPVEEVLAQWRAIAEDEEIATLTVHNGNFFEVSVNSLLVSLLDAMERFFLIAAETPEVRQRAFADGLVWFKQWADDKESEPGDDGESSPTTVGHFGLLMFIKLARILLPGEAGEHSWPPVLLTLIEPQEQPTPYRLCLAEMFERMLRDPAAQPTALDLLRNWLERVERELSYEPQMRTLLSDLLARDGEQGEIRRLLARHLGLWSPCSRFTLHEPRPDLKHLRRTVLVVDSSQSALPFWHEIKSIALEVGSALPEQSPPEVYRLNNGQAQALASLAGKDPGAANQQTTACSLIAPVMHDLSARRQQVDALILIGNGEVFDLADWLEDPLIDRWVLVRSGPDHLIGNASGGVEEVSGDSLSVIYERLCAPASEHVGRRRAEVASAVAAEGTWRIDRSGYPLIYVKPLQCYVHLFPIAKAQFERFLADETQSDWNDEEYAEMLRLHPRVSFRASDQTNCIGLFLTAVKPEEAKAFGSWLGDEYELPDERQWLACYDWLGQQPVTAAPPQGLADDALAVWQAVTAQGSPRTLLELSLMPEGIREWVRMGSEKYGGLGCPVRRFPTLNRAPRKLVNVSTTTARHEAYGFRLLAR